ncbi:hypothetical protein N0V83_000351 [Neocucurbitaria cava]|uniref:Uncharacterized protein n=1 Tax=Neocucurbitaria cava TaxID=798079 RepID=A0A9W9CR34_9PLEO|nr:hypothetical protein N0V83_000351 [Neocucurbitaria cava]
MSNNTFTYGTLPSFTFPDPGPPLPPSSNAYITLNPPGYPKPDLQWYLLFAISNATMHPRSGFGSTYASIRTHDTIEPRWSEPAHDYVTNGSLILYCAVCKYPDSYEARSNDEVWRACDYYDSDEARLNADIMQQTEYDIGPNGGEDVTIEIGKPVIPVSSSLYADVARRGTNRTMACMAALRLNENLNPERSENSMVMSQLFLVQDTPHGDESNWFTDEDYLPHLYNSTWPGGIADETRKGLGKATPSSTRESATATATCGAMRSGDDCGGWANWDSGKKVGVILGALSGVGVLLLCYLFYWRAERYQSSGRGSGGQRRRPRPMLLSEYRAQQRREREEQEARGRTSYYDGVARLEREAAAGRADAGAGRRSGDDAGGESDKPPPAYNEVVSAQEGMLASYAIRRDERNGNADAPSSSPPPLAAEHERSQATEEDIARPTTPLPSYHPSSDQLMDRSRREYRSSIDP